MCFYIVFLIALILSLVIISTITRSNNSSPTKETFERCLCSPLGEPQCSVYTGPSQYDRQYAYDNYGGLSGSVAANIDSNVMSSTPLLFGGTSQADKGYAFMSNNIVTSNDIVGVAAINAQSAPILFGGTSQADKGYSNVQSDYGNVQSAMIPLSYGIVESDKMNQQGMC
jgi:hypothetical protein